MADTKNYGLKGVGNDVQLGKAGSRINLSGTSIQARNAADGAFVIVKGLTPAADEDLATKLYVDNVAAGLDTKESCRAATTVALTMGAGAGEWGYAAGVLTNVTASTTTIDGVLLAENDRLLIKDQGDAKQNGIYAATNTGVGSATVFTRSSDMDGSPASEVSGGNYTFIEQGTTNANSGWVLQGDGVLTLDSDNLVWVLFSTSSDIAAGNGLIKNGNAFDLDFSQLTSASTLLTSDELIFQDGTVESRITVANFIADRDIVTTTSGATGFLVQTGNDTYTATTIAASATASEEGIIVNNGDGSPATTIGLDIEGATAASTNAVNTDELILFDGTNNKNYTILELSAAPAFDTAGKSIADADGDTKIHTESTTDEDIIRFDVGDNVTGYPAQGDALIFSSGQFTLALPTANVATTAGGAISLTSGIGNTTGDGGAVSVTSGAGGATGDGGVATLAAGASGAGATGDGGAVAITAGTSAATNGAGGAVAITSGAGNGSGADGLVTISAGSVEALRFTGNGTSVIQTHEANVGLTAHVGSSQGDGVITSTYNVYSVVASAGDAATLPAVFPVGTLIYVKNDDATESMDVFPASGDDAGAGTDTAVVVAATESATFIATAADATWSVLITEGGAGSVPTQITVGDSTDSTSFPAFFESATGDLGPKTDASNYTYDASTGALTATSFVGNLTLDSTTFTTVDTAGEFTDNDVTIMTAAAIADKIELYGYSTTVGTVTGTQTDNQVAIGTATTALDGSANFTFDGTTVTVAGVLIADEITIDGDTISNNTTDQPLNLQANGTGSTIIQTGASEEILELNDGTGTIVNGLAITPGATGTPALIAAGTGSDANVDIGFIGSGTGVLTVTGTTAYEVQVTDDDDIPNKKYVDDAITNGAVSGALDSITGTVSLTSATVQTIGGATDIPASCTIMSVTLDVDTLSDAATTVTIGDTTNGAASYMSATENDPQVEDTYIANGYIANLAVARQANATVVTAGSVGSATCVITFRHA